MAQLVTTASSSTQAERQVIYYEKSSAIMRQLKDLQDLISAHGAQAAGAQYHWGFIGDLGAIEAHLSILLKNDEE